MIRAVTANPGAIIDCGAGHGRADAPAVPAGFRAAPAPDSSKILLLASPSPAILTNRPRSEINGLDANRPLIQHPAHYAPAKHVVDSAGKIAAQTRDEILARLGLQ